jgi:hypothetical protein
VWDADEYGKLPDYDLDTAAQPVGVFLCHQQTGRVCAGWAGCHDMDHALALRRAGAIGAMTADDIAATRDYRCPVPLFSSGREAADHGLTDVEEPGAGARLAVDKIARRLGRR